MIFKKRSFLGNNKNCCNNKAKTVRKLTNLIDERLMKVIEWQGAYNMLSNQIIHSCSWDIVLIKCFCGPCLLNLFINKFMLHFVYMIKPDNSKTSIHDFNKDRYLEFQNIE